MLQTVFREWTSCPRKTQRHDEIQLQRKPSVSCWFHVSILQVHAGQLQTSCSKLSFPFSLCQLGVRTVSPCATYQSSVGQSVWSYLLWGCGWNQLPENFALGFAFCINVGEEFRLI